MEDTRERRLGTKSNIRCRPGNGTRGSDTAKERADKISDTQGQSHNRGWNPLTNSWPNNEKKKSEKSNSHFHRRESSLGMPQGLNPIEKLIRHLWHFDS